MSDRQKQRQTNASFLKQVTEYTELDPPALASLGHDVSDFSFSLKELKFDGGTDGLVWHPMEDEPHPVDALLHWMIEDETHFCTDKTVCYREETIFFIKQTVVDPASERAAVLLFDVWHQNFKVFLFK